MQRPKSIIWFERLYLGSIAIGLVNTAANWSTMQAQAAAVPNSAILPSWFLAVTVGFGIGINLLLWYLVARRRSLIAKWILTVVVAIGLPGLASLYSAVQMGIISPFMGLVAVVIFAVQAAALVMLFKSDAKPWFEKNAADLGETFS